MPSWLGYIVFGTACMMFGAYCGVIGLGLWLVRVEREDRERPVRGYFVAADVEKGMRLAIEAALPYLRVKP